MSSSKHLDKICCIILCFALILTILFINAESLGVSAASTCIGYEGRLFDTSKVHTIDIIMNDWDGFIETCTNEEYTICSVVIDGEAYKNVGIRAKGNTSLSSVASYGNDRYSFKIEFDQYDDTKSYYGLDKLCLNNIIQDNTYMKDYLTYQMMGAFGVASPLCSYAYLTVNGEDFGLYLAVEAVEEAFLTRNYGNDYGALYKPDSIGMGGGRGNGKDFDNDMVDIQKAQGDGFMPLPDIGNKSNSGNIGGFGNRGNLGDIGGFGNKIGFGDMGGMGSMRSQDVSLIYSNDEYDSYSNIFENAKTIITDADKDRLIASIKKLNENTDIEEIVNIEAVIRYFVVHNFVVNFDSYTGSMIHNYYLYEKDGKMEMIPWDYNLAFGSFMSFSDTTSLVNYPIDSPVSGGTTDSRPMLAWIFANEEYTELYHKYFAEFLAMFFEDGTFEEAIDSISKMIAPYIEKQPTEFCTYDEFVAGAEALKDFCLLRAQSIDGQLTGTIPSTSAGQAQDNSSLIDATSLNTSDMGSMNRGGLGGGGDKGGFGNRTGHFEDIGNFGDMPAIAFPGTEEQLKQNQPQDDTSTSAEDSENPEQNRKLPSINNANTLSGLNRTPLTGNISSDNTQSSDLLLLGISVLILCAGLTFASLYGKKRR